MISIVLFSVIIAVANCQQVVQEPCPNVTVVQDFDVVRYLGLWQENVRFNHIFERGNCSTATYGPVSEEGQVKVTNVEIVNGEVSTIVGRAELANPNSTEAKLKVHFDTPPSTADYWVLGTDYDNYSLVWSCANFGGASIQTSWILGRTKPLSAAANDAVQKLIKSNGINPEYYQTHDDDNCRTYP